VSFVYYGERTTAVLSGGRRDEQVSSSALNVNRMSDTTPKESAEKVAARARQVAGAEKKMKVWTGHGNTMTVPHHQNRMKICPWWRVAATVPIPLFCPRRRSIRLSGRFL